MATESLKTRGARPALPSAFVWRRWHSLLGFWLVLFIIVHLITNSQAALMVGDDGRGFINGANALESLPFLPLIEALGLGVPILIHLIWGIKYLFTARYNSSKTDGSTPSLPQYGRNKAYTWQRVTAWLLIFGIIAHVAHMRFIERPTLTEHDGKHAYLVKVSDDAGLHSLSKRLNVDIQTQAQGMGETSLKAGQVYAIAPDFGTADLLMLRNTFKEPVMLVLYTLLVLTACYHAFNGLWTFMIKWGVTLTPRSQLLMLRICHVMMLFVGFLGLAAVWGTYWINLRT